MIRNRRGNSIDGQGLTEKIMDAATDDTLLKELAQLSETENFALKNRYMH